jgi:pimeloyl-ACP methyl ester carboxylesterase
MTENPGTPRVANDEHTAPRHPANHLTASLHHVVSADGTRIAFDQVGTGPTVILVDGAFCSRAFAPMAGLAPLLATQYTVITYDRRGRNASGDTPPYAVAREVEDLAALLDAAGGSACMYAISSGAALALHAAADGLPIEKLAIYEPPCVAVAGGPVPPADAPARLAELAASGQRDEAVAYYMREVIGMPAETVAGMRQAPMWSGLEAVAHTLTNDATIMGDWSVPADVSQVAIPTLALDGELSSPPLRLAVDAVANALADAQRQTLPRQTHDVAPDVLAPVIARFFSASAGPTG